MGALYTAWYDWHICSLEPGMANIVKARKSLHLYSGNASVPAATTASRSAGFGDSPEAAAPATGVHVVSGVSNLGPVATTKFGNGGQAVDAVASNTGGQTGLDSLANDLSSSLGGMSTRSSPDSSLPPPSLSSSPSGRSDVSASQPTTPDSEEDDKSRYFREGSAGFHSIVQDKDHLKNMSLQNVPVRSSGPASRVTGRTMFGNLPDVSTSAAQVPAASSSTTPKLGIVSAEQMISSEQIIREINDEGNITSIEKSVTDLETKLETGELPVEADLACIQRSVRMIVLHQKKPWFSVDTDQIPDLHSAIYLLHSIADGGAGHWAVGREPFASLVKEVAGFVKCFET
ncbi:hypothetical protein BDV95DRAFT_80192 [Massariosphaeria phaeospora]|uniref:Uncharacterized protein n=1 Tax=Massariosphaeria phaeospora TaxID=100035 RepID=A0A7C8M858_9PLEO|nr:hypothetical protein BDV95DRAFT_80192 [Massariosphaeria phaeospora]